MCKSILSSEFTLGDLEKNLASSRPHILDTRTARQVVKHTNVCVCGIVAVVFEKVRNTY